MSFKLTFFATDILLYILFLAILGFAVWASRRKHLREPWRQVFQSRLAIISATILVFYSGIALLDSIHFQRALPGTGNGHIHYSARVRSLLDVILSPNSGKYEKSYSAPFATRLFNKETMVENGKQIRDYPVLQDIAAHLQHVHRGRGTDIMIYVIFSVAVAFVLWLVILFSIISFYWLRKKQKLKNNIKYLQRHRGWRTFLSTLLIILILTSCSLILAKHYHICGTDKVGQDVFYQAVKSIRTGIIIGTITTLFMMPFAIILGTMAGFFGGIIDDIIQYIYTTLSSIPGVLLIAASVLAMQIYISNHPDIFNSLAERADARLLALCIILGVTSWTSLCRLLRAESLKLREMDYIQAARALGVRNRKIITHHLIPNVLHIVLITMVLDFSGLVLAEAVLTYVGVGVDPSTLSWGNMINSARLELAREPVVWWPLTAAFIFMFTLVLAANLFADTVRDAFDPRIRGMLGPVTIASRRSL